MVKEGETSQEEKERQRGERQTEKHSIVAYKVTVERKQKQTTSGSSGTERSGVVFEPRQGAEASQVESAATSFGESEGGLATHGAYSRTEAVDV